MLRRGGDLLFCCVMKLVDVMAELEAKGSAPIKRILMRHGAKEPFFGVKVGDMKIIAKKIKGRQELAHELYATGNGDAQYLAGMIADGRAMTRRELRTWASKASWQMVSNFPVAWVASEHPDGYALAREWIDARKEHIVCAGWSTLAACVTVRADEELPIEDLSALLDRVAKTIRTSPDLVRVQMNHFVIAVGTYVAPLGAKAIATARKMGRVEAEPGDTDCRIPDAEPYILKARRGAPIAPKRKTVRC
jgi:3-methyladenine DNA glycosylase AlkD